MAGSELKFTRYAAWLSRALDDELQACPPNALAGRFRLGMRRHVAPIEVLVTGGPFRRQRFERRWKQRQPLWKASLTYRQIDSLHGSDWMKNRAVRSLNASLDDKRVAWFSRLSRDLERWWDWVFERLYHVDEHKYVNTHVTDLLYELWKARQ